MRELKRLIAVEVVLLALSVVFFSTPAFASNAADLPSWLQGALQFVEGLPYVGSIIVGVVKWMSIAVAILTTLVAFLDGVAAAVKGVAAFSGLETFDASVDSFYQTLRPYLAYFSMYNVQKKPNTK